MLKSDPQDAARLPNKAVCQACLLTQGPINGSTITLCTNRIDKAERNMNQLYSDIPVPYTLTQLLFV